MRVRAFALAILVFAGVDLLLLAIAPVVGWVDVAGTGSTWTVVALAAAFFLALLAMIGAVSVLATDFREPLSASTWDPSCPECGRMPRLSVSFCHHCGAAA